MSFEIGREPRDGVVILRLNGRFVIGGSVESFRSTMQALYDEGSLRAVIDLREVDYVDSSALGCLVLWHTTYQKAEGALVLFGLQQRQLDLMVITKLVTVFRIEETEMDAIDACFPQRETKPFDILSFVESQRTKKDGEVE